MQFTPVIKTYLTCTPIYGQKKRECLLIRKIESLVIHIFNNSYPIGTRSLYSAQKLSYEDTYEVELVTLKTRKLQQE